MKRYVLSALLVTSLSLSSPLARPLAAAAGTACANLAALSIPDVTVNGASLVAPGPFTPPGSVASLTLPAFCRVEATARPTSDS